MKTIPTELDREAARLFDANCRGLRAYLDGFGWCVVSTVRDHFRVEAEAIDTDDPATVGCMLAQVEGMRPGLAVTIVDRLVTIPNEPDRRFAVLVSNGYGVQDVFTGPTRGAALVAAKRALTEAAK